MKLGRRKKERYIRCWITECQTTNLKLKSPLGATGACWDVLIWRDVRGGDPQGRASSTVTHHLSMTQQWDGEKHECGFFMILYHHWNERLQELDYVDWFKSFFFFTWCGSGAIFFLNRWKNLLSSVSCIAISSRSVSARALEMEEKYVYFSYWWTLCFVVVRIVLKLYISILFCT